MGESDVGLPAGTVTFWFSDIEGSTERWQADEAAMSTALAAHDETVRATIGRHDGIVFKHTGDGVCAVFTSAADAVAAAIETQEQLELPVRIGIHTGQAEVRGGDYFGQSLNRVARIMDAGHGRQILVSSATAALTPHVGTTELGEYRLKGLDEPEQIFQVGDGTFPPLRTPLQLKGNLPVELTDFVGRSGEVAGIIDRLADHRLVTLIGVGGTGKTRLATRAAAELAPRYPDGCWLVELAVVAAPEAIPFAIATGLGIQPPESGDVIDHVIGRIRHQRRLLVIDNCEHLLAEAAEAVERIVAACSEVTVLATSREPLMVAGEQLVAVPSLQPDEAVEMFMNRAWAEAPELVLDDTQTAAIEAVCTRLDRLPLAIELAAARLRALTPVEILEHLDERFRLLVGGRRSRMERHQTMRGTLDWSYDLCDATERAVFDRLAVFPSEFDLGAARAVAADEAIDEFSVIDTVPRLVDRSLLQRTSAPHGTSRYRMLETMRAYGREHLRDEGSADTVRGRHARYVARRASELSLRAMGPDEDRVHDEMRSLIADALVALDWLTDQRDWDAAIRTTTVGWLAAYRTFTELNRRLHDAVIEIDGSLDGLDPHTQFQLHIFGTDRLRSFQAEEQGRLAALAEQLCFGGAPAPTDVVLISPYHGLALEVDELDTSRAASYLRSLDAVRTMPLVHQFNAIHAVHELLTQTTQVELAVEHRAELTQVVESLASPTAWRRYFGLLALQAELVGDRVAASGYAVRALPTEVAGASPFEASGFDVSYACRLLRNLALGGLDFTGDDVRRPWRWIESGQVDIQRGHAALTAAFVADRLERHDLCDRLLAWIRRDFPLGPAHWALIHAGMSDRFLAAASHDDGLETLVAEIFQLATELDRAGSVAALTSS